METIDITKNERKQHRASRSGVKARKKDAKDKKRRGLSTERHNPKAFSVANVVRTKRMQQRNLDRAQQKEVVPLVNRSEEELSPPVCVVVMGPPRCGKSTLIRSLVKIFTNQNLVDVLGPITVVASKNKRLTFIECPQDIHAMTDLAKVADLVLLMVDGSYGFEMETFEFLNILQLHGFPKVLGVVTHLDKFKLNKTLQNTKKTLKHRFWTEIYKGAKMFDFTGVVNGKYLKHEVKRLMLHLSRIKFRPLVWRNTHPYVVVDRVEDVTPTAALREDPQCDRDVVLMGYVRGTHLKPSMRVHLMGVGDFDMQSVLALKDPCPVSKQAAGEEGQRSLKVSKEALLYAPMANVGRVRIDKDGTYIELHDVHYTKPEYLDMSGQSKSASGAHQEGTPASLLRNMQDLGSGVDDKLRDAELSLFLGSKGVRSSDVIVHDADVGDDSDDSASSDEDADEDDDEDESSSKWSRSEKDSGSEGYSDSEEDEADALWTDEENVGESAASSDDGDEYAAGEGERQNDASVNWKAGMKVKAAAAFLSRTGYPANGVSPLMHSIYGPNWMQLTSDARQTDWSSALGQTANNDKRDATVSQNRRRSPAAGLWDDDNECENQDKFEQGSSLASRLYTQNNLCDSHRALLEPSAYGWAESDLLNMVKRIRNKFVTGDWTRANTLTTDGDESDGDIVILKIFYCEGLTPMFLVVPSEASDGDESNAYGDFEDLQTGEVFSQRHRQPKRAKQDSDLEWSAEVGSGSDDDKADSVSDDSDENDAIDAQLRQINAAKKAASRSRSDNVDDEVNFDPFSIHTLS
jgi:ribosome biogenesis protein BMS1